ncbi:MAG: YkgJ family cysteine cluster protein [Scytonema sp. PMC 1069.18]|nr:YkgJ family cysteine cluster protein [Scytonema sp. PMC 1069.18]MEC4885283.1 YkgJ family cysteine cluster protein [Scytonema sp. PMC 1070.18]
MNNSTDGVQQKLQLLDERVESRFQAIREGRNWWPCRRGCDHCCRHLAQPPELSPLEWARVDEAIAALAVPIRAEVEKKIHELLIKIAENTVGSQVVCPYLDENSGSCLIYDSRPIACRTYGFFVGRDRLFIQIFCSSVLLKTYPNLIINVLSLHIKNL